VKQSGATATELTILLSLSSKQAIGSRHYLPAAHCSVHQQLVSCCEASRERDTMKHNIKSKQLDHLKTQHDSICEEIRNGWDNMTISASRLADLDRQAEEIACQIELLEKS